MFFKQIAGHSVIFVLSAFLLAMLAPLPVWAHGVGAAKYEDCRIPIIGQQVHFRAYTPELTGDDEYCNAIPQLGLTTLVFDYEQKPLRKMMVEFEITKEPEGKRVFYQEPKMQKTGSMNVSVDFTSFEAGDYLLHVTLALVGRKLEAHLPFTAGVRDSSTGIWAIFIAIVILLFFFCLRSLATRSKVHSIVSGDDLEKENLDSTAKHHLSG